MKLTGINKLWVADITYVRLKGEFVYLAVILDGFSRKVVGWALDQTMTSSRLTVAALEGAVAERQPPRVSCITPIEAFNMRTQITRQR